VEVIDDIQRFNSQFPHTPIIVTSRVVGYQPQRLRDAEFRHFMMQDLDSSQITAFLNRWHEMTFDDPEQAAPKRDRLEKAIRESRSIAMLAGNPLLLTMMAILNRNQELPRDRGDLYAQASRVLLHQWDTERALEDFPGMSNEIGLREKSDILRRIAAHMQAAPGGLKGNLIDGPTLTKLVEDYLQNELHFAQSRAAARAVVEQLRQRNFILCFVGADRYAFVHRTFLEYFCATDFVHQFNVAKTMDIDGLIALYDQHCRDDEWREVLRLICGQIDEAFVGRVVEHLVTRTDLEKWDGRTPLAELPLAIGCLDEARNKGKLGAVTELLLDRCVHAICGAQLIPLRYDQWLFDIVSAVDQSGIRATIRPEWRKEALAAIQSVHHTMYVWPHFVRAAAADRQQIVDLAINNVESSARWAAIEVLSDGWPDQTTRDLLAQRAVGDSHESLRRAALEVLAEKWPDQTTRDLLAQRALESPDISERGTACSTLGKMHSEFGSILPTRDLDGMGPYLDPLEPIAHEHIKNAAVKAGIRPGRQGGAPQQYRGRCRSRCH
jgi:hypothetical protein